jgi:hypothetical protein
MFNLFHTIRVADSCYFILYFAICTGAWIRRNDSLSVQIFLRKKGINFTEISRVHLINNANHQQKHEIFGMNYKIIMKILILKSLGIGKPNTLIKLRASH